MIYDETTLMKNQREQEAEDRAIALAVDGPDGDDLQEQKEEREAEYAEMEYAASEPW